MRTFFTLFVSIVFSITLIGCVTQTKQPIRQELSDTIIKNVANDAAAFLAHQFPPKCLLASAVLFLVLQLKDLDPPFQ